VGYAERVADDKDQLRYLLRGARAWRVPPSVFIGERTVRTSEWEDVDTALAMVLEDYEAACDERGHYLPETTKPEHDGAYRPDPGGKSTCYKCWLEALMAEVAEERGEDTAGVFTPIVLDPELVALNLLPVPPLPPELAGTP
jgi:hypothetical protein